MTTKIPRSKWDRFLNALLHTFFYGDLILGREDIIIKGLSGLSGTVKVYGEQLRFLNLLVGEVIRNFRYWKASQDNLKEIGEALVAQGFVKESIPSVGKYEHSALQLTVDFELIKELYKNVLPKLSDVQDQDEQPVALKPFFWLQKSVDIRTRMRFLLHPEDFKEVPGNLYYYQGELAQSKKINQKAVIRRETKKLANKEVKECLELLTDKNLFGLFGTDMEINRLSVALTKGEETLDSLDNKIREYEQHIQVLSQCILAMKTFRDIYKDYGTGRDFLNKVAEEVSNKIEEDYPLFIDHETFGYLARKMLKAGE